MADRNNSPQFWRLRKHADYQRVYREGRRQSLPLLTYFFAARVSAPEAEAEAPRVGLTTGRVLGKAVERNRIKRRMRAVVRKHVHVLQGPVDVVLHPRRQVLEAEFTALEREVARAFAAVMRSLSGSGSNEGTVASTRTEPQPSKPERRLHAAKP
jgi:ribonuclease P protein component